MKKFIEIAETNGWSVYGVDDTHVAGEVVDIELNQGSSAGQDFYCCIQASDYSSAKEAVYAFLQNYDVNEEAMLWVGPDGRGRNGAPSNLSDIIADMQDCKDMVRELYEALCAADGCAVPIPIPSYYSAIDTLCKEICQCIVDLMTRNQLASIDLDEQDYNTVWAVWFDNAGDVQETAVKTVRIVPCTSPYAKSTDVVKIVVDGGEVQAEPEELSSYSHVMQDPMCLSEIFDTIQSQLMSNQ